jgi:hypothetical protein
MLTLFIYSKVYDFVFLTIILYIFPRIPYLIFKGQYIILKIISKLL